MARPMQKQLEALRLICQTHLSDREIGAATGLSKTTVGRYRRAMRVKRLGWTQLQDYSPADIDAQFNQPHRGNKVRPSVDMARLHGDLSAHKMTLQVWYEDYSRTHGPHIAAYSTIARGLRRYRDTLPSFMHMLHRPGERVMVDFSGEQASYIDVHTRQRVKVTIFVGVLPASSYVFAQAIRSQAVAEVMQAHVDMFAYFGGVPQLLVPDNAKSFMTKPGPGGVPQRIYEDLARHYRTTVAATRVYRPKDKAKVEASVKVVQQQILTRLRTLTLYSLEEVQDAILPLLAQLNKRPMANNQPSRWERFKAIERDALQPLPKSAYEYAEIKDKVRVDGGYHVLLEHHRYSVPHEHTGQQVTARLSAKHIWIYRDQKLIARHDRSTVVGGLTTNPDHQPATHRAQGERTPEALQAWAQAAGPTIGRFVRRLFSGDRPYMGLRPADELKTLASKYGTPALERALQDFHDLDFANVTDVRRKLSVQAKEGAAPTRRARSTNARGPASFNPTLDASDEIDDPFR